MNWEAVWDVLKWVLAALAAGFIGQFGRSLALRIIERRRRRKAQEARIERPHALPGEEAQATDRPSLPEPDASERALATERLDALAKIEKKRAKAEVKRAKKSSD